MQTVVVPTSFEGTAGVLVDDEHFLPCHDVVFITLEQFLGLDGVVQVRDERGVRRLVEIVDAEAVFHLLDAGGENRNGALLFVDLVILVARERFHHPGEDGEPFLRVLCGARDDERRTGFVDENRVDLVDDGVVVPALHHIFLAQRHVVAQIVEAEFVVSAVRDVGCIGVTTLRRCHLCQDRAHPKPEEVMDSAHLLRLILGEVVVGGDDVYTLTRQRVEVARQRTDQRLTFTGLHLSDVAPVQGGATHELHIEVTLAAHTHRRLTHRCEGLGHEFVERLSVSNALLEFVCFSSEFRVGEGLKVFFDRIDLVCHLLQLLQLRARAQAAQEFHETHVECPSIAQQMPSPS